MARRRPRRRRRRGVLLPRSTTTRPRCPTPARFWLPSGVHSASRLYDHDAFFWSDHNWTGRQLPGSVLYELHIGTFTEGGTFDSAIEKLDHLVCARDRPGRGAARQRRRRRPQLGLRRRRLVRRHRELRWPGRVQAFRRRLPRSRSRGRPRRRLQPHGPVGRLPRPVRPLLRGQHRLGPHRQPRRRPLRTGAPLRHRQRADVAARLPPRRAPPRRRARPARPPRECTCWSR